MKLDSIQGKEVKEVKEVRQVEEVYVICEIVGHSTDNCHTIPALRHHYSQLPTKEVCALNQRWDPYSNTYNPGLRSNSAFRWGNQNEAGTSSTSQAPPPPQNPTWRQPQFQGSPRFLAIQGPLGFIPPNQFHGEREASYSTFAKPSRSNLLGSSSVTFPKQANAIISLRSGKTVDNAQVEPPVTPILLPFPVLSKPTTSDGESPKPAPTEEAKGKAKESEVPQTFTVPAPYPNRLKTLAKPNLNNDIYNVLKQVTVNLPLLDAIKQILSYAKFLKDLCTHKCKLQVQKKVVEKVFLDLGASVNLLLFLVYEQLGLGEMKPTRVTLQLADRSICVPKGMVEDVLVQVDQFVYPVDFVVLDTCPVPAAQTSVPIILGRPFLATSDAVIHCRDGRLNMSFGNMKMQVNMFHIGSQMGDGDDVCGVSMIDSLVQDHVDEFVCQDELELALTSAEADFLDSPDVAYLCSLLDAEEVCGLNPWIPKFKELPPIVKQVIPSSVEPPTLDLKPLSDTLKYAYLGDGQTYPVVISSALTELQEFQLLAKLQKHSTAIGWSIADIKAIDASLCSHHIYMKDDVKPSRQPQ
ncbi:uncharacterized protein LOC131321158 [Rhododendron vialii]|uniref:uncharacterized protein LOC131321158 n=1 Tax=Rhododendron vialii TaxID=182163 RepID=UPI00265F2734|nr:uncharacterized protein LOC131321158 [Rhododendron vialii]